MTENQKVVLSILEELKVEHSYFTHPAVFTTADVAKLTEEIPGRDTKNLFLRDDKRSRFILVCVRAETRVNLKELGKQLGMKGVTFASPEDLQALLGITPGSVCLFALMNDTARKVEGFLDASIDSEEQMQNHPLENTTTVVITAAGLQRFCAHVGHTIRRIGIPTR